MLPRSHTTFSFRFTSRLDYKRTQLAVPLRSAAHIHPRQAQTSAPKRTGLNPRPSSLTVTALAAGFVIASTAYYLAWQHPGNPPHDHPSPIDSTDPKSSDAMAPIAFAATTSIPAGRPGNLTPEQEAKLRELWGELARLTGEASDRASTDANGRPTSPSTTTDDTASTAPSSCKKKRRFGSFGRKTRDENSKGGADEDDKHGSNKEFRAALQDMTPQELRTALWDFAKCDEPDANMCRYLRARKWNVHDALVMLVSTIHWRQRTMRLDDRVMVYGEEAAMKASRGDKEGTGDLNKKLADDMLEQLRMGKTYLHGVDKEGRPLCFVRVRLHKGGEHCEESLERLTVYMIETARFMLNPPYLETAVLIFDMTGFSLANMDYTPVKFMIKVFEANYPESLGAVLVHKAPWVFQGIWSVIKGWLDPVVASKISFTKNEKDLQETIDAANIPKDLGGDEDWEYKYVEPIEGENRQMEDVTARKELEEERAGLLDAFEKATMDWVVSNGVNDGAIKARRAKLSKELHDNYWQLDPFIRSRSMYDRIGVIAPGGKIHPYSNQAPKQVESSADKHGPSKAAAAGYGLQPNARAKDDARSLRSVDSVYYDAHSELD